MKTEHKSFPIEGLKTDETGVIEAIVSVFSNIDSGNEKVMPGFFTKSISKKLPKGVWAHNWDQPIAKTLEARELLPGDPLLPASLNTLGGAYIKGQFNLDTQRGREAYSDIKFGIVDEFSIGYSVISDKKDDNTGVRELIEGDWKEWSPVLVGMNPETALISIKSDLPDGQTLAEHSESVLAAVEGLTTRAKTVAEMRSKEGRQISSANRQRLQELHDAIGSLLAASEPKPKEKTVDALWLESQRIESEVLATLMQRNI
jgi:HK97 family phage prohead protease